MTAPAPDDDESGDQQEAKVPPVSPAYATPPPEGPPDADHP
ncbi:hypothetical protein [Mycolicibacterium tusciae]|nr:hypothetical protein [Mycolicibacterium tusciae]